jgi:hypothetical protein
MAPAAVPLPSNTASMPVVTEIFWLYRPIFDCD